MAQDSSQNRGATWWMVALAVLVGGLIWGRPPGSVAVKSPTPATDRTGSDAAAAEPTDEDKNEAVLETQREIRLLGPLSEYFGADKSLDLAGVKDRLGAEGHDAEFDLSFLIVVVADPVESAISYSFDLQLDALHRAMAAENLIPDAFYLPWNPFDKKEAGWRREPGVLLFRQSAKPETDTRPGLLLVLLVGEQPTTGVHQAAFRESVRLIGKLESIRPARQKKDIMVAGLTFTGSAPSLARAIRDSQAEITRGGSTWPHNTELSFKVITGAAIGVDRAAFKQHAEQGGHCTVEFGATVGHVAPLKEKLIDYVRKRHPIGEPRIAWLTESVTGFGAASGAIRKPSADSTTYEREKITRGSEESKEEPLQILELPFPVNIARVRATYEQVRREQAVKGLRSADERYRLEIPFDDPQESTDLPPLFTPRITAPTNELVLGQIMEMIRREGIEYVGISASDIRDPIFLSKVIRQHAPEVQILLVTSDLVHLHPSYRSSMRGTLVASSYPFFPDAQNWCYPRQGDRRRIVLSNQELYGLYNAVRLLREVQEKPTVLKELSPLTFKVRPSAQLLVYGPPLAEQPPFQPAIWISMIGNDGIWPLRSYPYPKQEDNEENWDYVVQVIPEQFESSSVALKAGRNRENLANRGGHTTKSDAANQTKREEHRGAHFTPMSYASQFTWAIFGLVIAAGAAGKLRISPLAAFAFYQERNSRQRLWFRWTLGFFLAFLALLVELHAYLALTTLVVCGADSGSIRDFLEHWREILGLALASVAMATIFGTFHSVVRLGEPETTWRAMALGLAIQLMLLLVVVAVLALVIWRLGAANLLLWAQYMTEEFNGISPLLTLKLTLLATLALLYGLLKQLYLLRTEFHPWPRRPGARREHTHVTRRRLIFPVWQRYIRDSQRVHRRRERPPAGEMRMSQRLHWLLDESWTLLNSVFVPLGAALLVGVLLLWLGWSTLVVDVSWILLRFTVGLLLFACAYWALRLIKAIEMINQCDAQMDELYGQIGQKDCRQAWERVLGNRRGDELAGLRRFLSPRPIVEASRLNDLRTELRSLEPKPGQTLTPDQEERRRTLENEIFAFRVEVYAFQYFAHLRRLAVWLLVTAVLLYMAATSYPLNTAGWFRLLVAGMIVALGGAMIWGYLKLDRNELLSLICGTTPHQLHWDWSLVTRLGPVLLLGAIALLGAAFPELWHWLSMVSEPLIVPMQ